MIIIGHELVPFKAFYRVKSKSDISITPSNSNVIFKFDDAEYKQLSEVCLKSGIVFAVETNTITQILLVNAIGASYIIVDDKALAKEAQRLAEHYLFDAKILLRVSNESEMNECASFGIDGVLFNKGER